MNISMMAIKAITGEITGIHVTKEGDVNICRRCHHGIPVGETVVKNTKGLVCKDCISRLKEAKDEQRGN